MASHIIEIQNLSKRFGDNAILDNVSINVEEAENLVVFGRSGTGKSVLLKCIVGLMKPDAGEILIKDENVWRISLKALNEIRKKVGFLFQGAALYDSMSVRENLQFPLTMHFDHSQKEMDEKTEQTLELVGLEGSIDKMPSELSGGMRKRIGLARSIITDPEIMFYDEPTTGLDPISSKEISELILDLQKKLKMTSIIVTHDLICAEIIADRAIFLRNSKIAFEGEIDKLTKSDDPFLKNFFSHDLIEEEGST